MKYFRKIKILLILFVVGLTIETCYEEKFRDDCNCPEGVNECSISSFSIDQVDEVSLSRHPIPESLECRKDFALVLRFYLESTFIAKCKPFNSLFLQSAYACSCYYPCSPKDSIISTRIFSDKDFGEAHPAGTDIAELFKIWTGESELISFEDFKFPYIARFACVLTETTIEEGEYEFTFVVNLSDERTLKQSLKVVFN